MILSLIIFLPLIDNVRVTDVTPVVAAPAPVPALGLWGLLGLSGLLGGLALRRSRRA